MAKKSKNVVIALSAQATLKRRLRRHLTDLGFTKSDSGDLTPPGTGKDAVRVLHAAQRNERFEANQRFIGERSSDLVKHFASGAEIDPARISPVLQLISGGTWESDLFRLASLTWSVPVSAGFGRRLRYLVWDEHNGRLIGIIAIGDPVFKPISLRPGHYPTDVALRTVSEALAKSASDMLEIEPGELMAEYRPSLTPEGRHGLKAEIFLYDTLPGGAGFASQLVDKGEELFKRALRLVTSCPEDCDASCYRCLRSFKNKFEHGLLDRHVAAELLEYVLSGKLPEFDAHRLRRSTALLHADLVRQTEGENSFLHGATVNVGGSGEAKVPILGVAPDGTRHVIALSGPLTPDEPADPAIARLRGKTGLPLVVVNELLVRGNLPAATREIRQRVGF